MARTPIRVGLMADIQYGDMEDGVFEGGIRYFRRALQKLETAVTEFAADTTLVGVLHLGDIINGNESHEMTRADLNAVAKMYKRLPATMPPLHVLETAEVLLSRGVAVQTDTRGNLGPGSVITQDPPGKDWIRDRWQAASDMGGTAIPGSHWVVLDFGETKTVRPSRLVLDWEAAHAENYRIEGRLNSTEGWNVLYDGGDPAQESRRTKTESGQSPGVNFKLPLHRVHEVKLAGDPQPLRFMRVFIVKPAAGWGVSLWQVDVYGPRGE
eukprot:g1553.t1